MCAVLAHSANKYKPGQQYKSHVAGVVSKVHEYLSGMRLYVSQERWNEMESFLIPAACFHDLGKLDEANQNVLNDRASHRALPIEHRDAGIKHLRENCDNPIAATLVYGHHRPGLPNAKEEEMKKWAFRYKDVAEHTEIHLDDYLKLHIQEFAREYNFPKPEKRASSSLEFRILQSCLVDADYTDSSGEEMKAIQTRWIERLEKLDQYVTELQEKEYNSTASNIERLGLRQEMYQHCRMYQTSAPIIYCNAPVGTGKAIALIAYLLSLAERNRLRHIFVVLPYISIISQTVEIYRKALVLDGEDPQIVIAEHHHQADYDDVSLRHLAETWSAPIIITTAVQFFESLASNIPSKLRKVHQLPGSAVLIDESHAALPSHLMPLAWTWMEELSKNWGCQFCLSSGTTIEYWKTDFMRDVTTLLVEPILSDKLSEKLLGFENSRVKCNFSVSNPPHFSNVYELMNFIESKQGPRIVVMNTIMSAAALATFMRNAGMDVLHLSTALTPADREHTLEIVKTRLKNYQPDDNWTLVATSCVECGLNLSFRNGFCELRSLHSNVNRLSPVTVLKNELTLISLRF